MAPSVNSKLRGAVERRHHRPLARAARGQVDGDRRLAFDPLKGRHRVEEGIGVEIGEREAEGLHRGLAGRVDGKHAGADAAIELEVRQLDLELAAGHAARTLIGPALIVP